jgi:chemotaxis protein MotB
MLTDRRRPVACLPARRPLALPSTCALGLALLLGGCVFQSTYNNMLQQQQAIEAALRSEISADQVEIEQLKDGIRVRMSNDLLYREGDIDLTAAGRAALDKVAPQLTSGGMEIDVVGNTDNVPIGPELAGRYPSNWELAGARASIVVRYLQAQGVNPAQLESVSNGQYHPVASNDTAAGRAQNRRTDILIRPTGATQ